MTSRTRTGSPRNQTGLYAAPALTEGKPPQNQSSAENQNRTPRSAKFLLALSEQKRHRDEQSRLSKQDLAQHDSTEQKHDAGTDSQSSRRLLRNGFRPSAIRRQKQRLVTTMSPRDEQHRQDLSPKQTFVPSPGSARLRSEIEHLSNQLRSYEDPSRTSRLAQNRDVSGASFSPLSSFVSHRPSSGSTNAAVSRPPQRVPSNMKVGPPSTIVSIPLLDRTSNKSPQSSSTVSASSQPPHEDNNRPYVNYQVAHAYQVPQQSNVGSESAFPSTSLSTTIKTRATRLSSRNNGEKTISCPFYVMYFTNLALQQTPPPIHNEKASPPILSTTTTPRRATATSRIGTAHSRHTSNRRQVASPLSMFSRATIEEDDDEYLLNVAPYYNSKRFSAKMVAFETENSHLLKDVLRTTAWNHVQI